MICYHCFEKNVEFRNRVLKARKFGKEGPESDIRYVKIGKFKRKNGKRFKDVTVQVIRSKGVTTLETHRKKKHSAVTTVQKRCFDCGRMIR